MRILQPITGSVSKYFVYFFKLGMTGLHQTNRSTYVSGATKHNHFLQSRSQYHNRCFNLQVNLKPIYIFWKENKIPYACLLAKNSIKCDKIELKISMALHKKFNNAKLGLRFI